jgi:hypothetical protein
MSKTLKIIIVTISVLATILAIYIAPKIIPYTLPTPNIVKTDQGSFELRLTNDYAFSDVDLYSYEKYLEYENYAKDYFKRISSVINNPNLIINQDIFFPGEGLLSPTITFYLKENNNGRLFEAIYIYNYNINKFDFYSFVEYYVEGNPKKIPLDELLQTPKYKNLKLN